MLKLQETTLGPPNVSFGDTRPLTTTSRAGTSRLCRHDRKVCCWRLVGARTHTRGTETPRRDALKPRSRFTPTEAGRTNGARWRLKESKGKRKEERTSWWKCGARSLLHWHVQIFSIKDARDATFEQTERKHLRLSTRQCQICLTMPFPFCDRDENVDENTSGGCRDFGPQGFYGLLNFPPICSNSYLALYRSAKSWNNPN